MSDAFDHVRSQLRKVRCDQHGTPDRKLPDCPRCEEDELYARFDPRATYHEFGCYRCHLTLDAADIGDHGGTL
jgi:hypothetical protein